MKRTEEGDMVNGMRVGELGSAMAGKPTETTTPGEIIL